MAGTEQKESRKGISGERNQHEWTISPCCRVGRQERCFGGEVAEVQIISLQRGAENELKIAEPAGHGSNQSVSCVGSPKCLKISKFCVSVYSKKILISKTASRDLHIPAIVTIKEEPATSKKQETKPKTPFGMMKPAAKVADKKPEAKKEIVEKPKAKTPEKKAEPPKKIVKEAKSSPEDSKPASKAPAGKKVQLKNQKPVKAGSISSFFSSKPGTSKAAAEKPKEQKKEVVEAVDDDVEMVEVDLKVKESKAVQVKKAKEPKVVKDEKAKEAKSKKRSLTPEPVAEVEVKKKKPAAKKIKMKDPPNKNKRSRIRVMEDSSDSEEEAKQVEDEPDSKFIKFDREFTPEVGSSPEATPEKKPEVGMAKNKAKRWVTKRYQTEEGFMRTERVQEEYSASEGENDENKKKNSPVTQKTSPAIKKKTPVSGRKSSEKKKKPAEAAKAAPAAKNKQGNIMSFFHKK